MASRFGIFVSLSGMVGSQSALEEPLRHFVDELERNGCMDVHEASALVPGFDNQPFVARDGIFAQLDSDEFDD